MEEPTKIKNSRNGRKSTKSSTSSLLPAKDVEGRTDEEMRDLQISWITK